MSTLHEVDENFYPVEPLPVPRIVREAEQFLNWMSLRSDGFTLNNEFYGEVERELGYPPHRLDSILDHIERTGRARSRDCGDGVSFRICSAQNKTEQYGQHSQFRSPDGNGKPTITMRPAGKWRES